jgi:hypothetical protein
MVPKILRALKATLFRRKPITSPSYPTSPSLHAEPQYPRIADNLHPSATRNLLLASASDAMLATSRLAEIVALFPCDDDNYYEGGASLGYTLDKASDSASMLSSMTGECSFDEFEGVVRCLNGMCFFYKCLKIPSLHHLSYLSVYGTDINSDADSTFSHPTCEESFEEKGIFINGMCFISQELRATCSLCLSSLSVDGAESGSDTTSTLSYAAAEESFEEGSVLADGMSFIFQELGNQFLMSPLAALDFVYEAPMCLAEYMVPVVEFPPVKVASSVPKRLVETLELRHDPEPGVHPPAELKVVDNIYTEPHYNTHYLTKDALLEAETCSHKIRRTAQMWNLDLVKIVPLKPHGHPEPQSLNKTSVLKGQGQSSPLKSSWNADGLEKEAYTEAFLEPSWEKEAEILKELDDFCSCGI